MSETIELTVPTGWTRVDPGPDGLSLDAAADALVARLDPESRAAWRSTVSGALEQALAPREGDDTEVLSLLVPAQGPGSELPVTVAVLRLATATSSPAEANQILAGIAARDATSRLLATDAGPAMRTHRVVPFGEDHSARLALDPAEMPSVLALRARYLLPPLSGGRWLALIHTVVGVTDESLPTWLELCDALVLGVRRGARERS